MKHLVSYQHEVDKGKLTTVASLGKLFCTHEGLMQLETSAFLKSLRRLIYPYQLHVDN